MPTRAPVSLLTIPQELWPAGPLNQYDWIDGGNPSGFVQSSFMRGQAPALAPWQQRPQLGRPTYGQGQPVFMQSRPYDRGAQAYAPQFGMIPANPIGSGVYAPYKLPVIAGPGGTYEFAAIWFDTQVVPTSMPINPTVPYETYQAFLASSSVGGMVVTTG